MAEPAWLKVSLDVLAVVAGIIAVFTFRQNSRLRRAEWLSNLHSKFFETERYKRVRHIVDYEPQPEFDNLRDAISRDQNGALAEEFVDYLNFFEFVASLWRMNQISTEEIGRVFEYYVLNLEKHKFVRDFIATQGFESLERLIPELDKQKAERKVKVKQ